MYDKEMIKKKILTFQELNLKVHVKLKSKEFRNGSIKQLFENYFLLDENKLGTIPIFYEEIYLVDKLGKKERGVD